MGYTSEISLEPSDIIAGVEFSDDVTDITVLLDTDEMVDPAIGASHRCDGSRHNCRSYRVGKVFVVVKCL